MRMALGSDHAGLKLKITVGAHLRALGHEVVDLGTFDAASTDYPDHAHKVAAAVASGDCAAGVLVCGTGHGMAIAANKHHGVRAACVLDTFSAKAVRAHNDCNVLCLGQRTTGDGLALELVDAWLGSTFEGGRHARRVDKIEA